MIYFAKNIEATRAPIPFLSLPLYLFCVADQLSLGFFLTILLLVVCRIYVVHDEVKDKNFELELSWIGEGTECLACLLTKTKTTKCSYVLCLQFNKSCYCKWRGLLLIKQSL